MRRVIGSVLGVAIAAGAAVGASGAAGATGSSAVDPVGNRAAVTATLGAWRMLPPGYFGINYDYGGATVYQADGNVPSQMAALDPGTLRWPAGTGANYFQWQKGYPVNPGTVGGGKCAAPKESEVDGFRFTLADLAAAYRRSGATPIFDLNVMTATLASQIAMLRTAQRQYRLPVRYVELGNEFYLCNTDYVKAFPTAKDYGARVAADVKALHQAFPGVHVAAVGAVPGSSARTQPWNAGVLSVARGSDKPDAITLHTHPQFNHSLTAGGLPALFAEPYTSAASVAAATSQFRGTPAWITEYGLSLHYTKGTAPQLTYANALFEGEAALLLAQKVSTATLIDYWSSFGPALNYAYDKNGLTPVGLAMQWLSAAAHGANAEAAVTFAGGPVLGPGGNPALVGEVFRAVGRRAGLLVNLDGETVTIAVTAIFPPGAKYRQVTGTPTHQYATAAGLSSTTGVTGRTLTLPPYSVTLVSA